MAELQSRSALADHQLPTLLTERDCTIIGIATHRDRLGGLQASVQEKFGVALPTTPHRVVAGDRAFVWAGPERWLLVADPRDDTLLEKCQDAIGTHASLTELGDGRCVLRLSGDDAGRALARLLPIDLHPRVFSPGRTAITAAGHVNVQIWQVDDAPCYDLVVARSFALELLHHVY